MEKDLQNAVVIVYKHKRALIKVINQRLEIAKEKIWKVDAIGTKRCKAKKRIGLFGKEEGNNESDIGDEIDPNQFNNTYLLQMLEAIAGKL